MSRSGFKHSIHIIGIILIGMIFPITALTDGSFETEDSSAVGDSEDISKINPTISAPEPGGSRGARGGELEWVYSAPGGGQVSTPALVDLDTDGSIEVVFATTGDEIIALNADGTKRWINSNYVFEPASYMANQLNLPFWPTDIFSSVKSANIDRDVRPELILGAYNGLVFLNHDGEPKFSQAYTGRFYFTTPVINDLEGDYSRLDMDSNSIVTYKDTEIITGSTDSGSNAYLEAWHATGGDVFDNTVSSIEDFPLMIGLSSGDIDGSTDDGKDNVTEEAWMEFVLSTYQKTMRIYNYSSSIYNSAHNHNHPLYEENTSVAVTDYLSYTTAAVGNFSSKLNPGNPEYHEIIVGKGGWNSAQSKIDTGAGLYSYDMSGNEHWHSLNNIIVTGSPAVADVHTENLNDATKHLAEYEIFAGNGHEGEFYCVDADNGTILWQWEINGSKSTSNRILSSPAILNINADDELEVVVGSDNGKVYCFDGDPSDWVNDGEEYSYTDEGTAKFDLLWEFDTHEHGGSGRIDISSPVVADIDKDGKLEVVVGDSNGMVWCISAGGTSGRGQRDWISFHNDLNNSGLYYPKSQFSVDIKMSKVNGFPDSREKFTSFHETVSFRLSVINTGYSAESNAMDRIYIQSFISSNLTNPGWQYELGGSALQQKGGLYFVDLPMQTQALIYLNVTAPATGEMGDFIWIVLRVNSSKDINAIDSLTTGTHLEIKLDFNLEFQWDPVDDAEDPYYGKKLSEIDSDKEYMYSIKIENTGDLNDTYNLTIENVPEGWSVKFLGKEDPYYHNTSIFLEEKFPGKNNVGYIGLSVFVPEEIALTETVALLVKGVSMRSQDEQEKPHSLVGLIERKDHMYIRTRGHYDFKLTVDDGEKYLEPGERARFKVHAINNGSFDLVVSFVHTKPGSGWAFTMPSTLELQWKANKIVEVFLTAPPLQSNVQAGARQEINIEGFIDSPDGILYSNVTIAGVLKLVRDINATLGPDVNSSGPGGTVGYFIKLENLGNADDNITIGVEHLDPGWSLNFPTGTEGVLKWNTNMTIPIKLGIPESAEPGIYYQYLNVTNEDLSEVHRMTLKTIVDIEDIGIEVYNEHVGKYTSRAACEIAPASSTIFDVLLRNQGTAYDVASLSVYLDSYTRPAVDGSSITLTKTISESDAMMAASNTIGSARWYFNSVRSINDTKDASPGNMDFNELIIVEPSGNNYFLPTPETRFVTHLQLGLQPDQEVLVEVRIDFPGSEFIDSMHFTVDAVSTGVDVNPLDNSVVLDFDIIYPDLTFDTLVGAKGMEMVGKLVAGSQSIIINVEVRNTGEADIENVLVVLFVDNILVELKSVEMVEGSPEVDPKDVKLAFKWRPDYGSHNIKIIVDPDETITELNEDNNVLTTDVHVSSSFDDNAEGSGLAKYAIVFAIIAILVMIVILFNRRSQRMDAIVVDPTEETDDSKDAPVEPALQKGSKDEPKVAAVIGLRPEEPSGDLEMNQKTEGIRVTGTGGTISDDPDEMANRNEPFQKIEPEVIDIVVSQLQKDDLRSISENDPKQK